DRKAADVRVGPRPRVLRRARAPPHRQRPGARRLPVVLARPRHRPERTVPDAKSPGFTRDRHGSRKRCRPVAGRAADVQARRSWLMIVTKAHLSRRTVLRGLGVSLALPLLDSMVPAMTALGQTAAAPVRRLGVFYVPNGMSMPYWWPKTEGPLKELPPTLQSLAAHKDNVLLCGGLADEAANLVKGG